MNHAAESRGSIALPCSTCDAAICLKGFCECGVAVDPVRLRVLQQH